MTVPPPDAPKLRKGVIGAACNAAGAEGAVVWRTSLGVNIELLSIDYSSSISAGFQVRLVDPYCKTEEFKATLLRRLPGHDPVLHLARGQDHNIKSSFPAALRL